VRPASAWLAALALACAACSPCKGKKAPGPTPASGARGDAGAKAPTGPVVLIAGPRPAVRDASRVAKVEGRPLVSARLMLSKVTAADGVRLALRFDRPASAPGDAGAGPSMYAWAATVASLRFKLKGPSGAEQTLALAAPPKAQRMGWGHVHELKLTASGLEHWGESSAWKEPHASVLGAVGRYTLAIKGEVRRDGAPPIAFSLEAVPFEVVPEGPSWRPVSALVAAASAALVARVPGAKPMVGRAEGNVIDDVNDGRWVRMNLGSDAGYDEQIADVLLSPAGEVVAARTFHHFTCVARGTTLSSPQGERKVEELSLGDSLWGYDLEAGRLVETRVERIDASTRADLIAIGGARVTPEHPVFLGGAWAPASEAREGAIVLGEGGRAVALGRVSSSPAPSLVFDLTVSAPHNFFAGGVLMHNKAVANPIAPGDPWAGLFLRATDAAPAPSR
jgi:hypothetical protein